MKTHIGKPPFRIPCPAAAALLVAAVLLSGCTPPRQWLANRFKVGPNYGRPSAAVAAQWLDASDPRVKTEQLKNVRWWQVFEDSILNSLVQSAYEQNLTLKEASFRVLEARLQLAIAAGNLFPQQQQAFADYQRTMASRNTVSGAFFPNRYLDGWDAGFNLSWELDLWGKYRRAIESSAAQWEASIEDYDAVLVTLIGDVAATYAQIRTLEQQITLASQNVELQKKTLDLTKIRFEGGAAGKLDVVQAEANLAQTESLIPPLDIALRQAKNRLCILLGLPIEDIAQRIGPGPIPATPIEAAVGIPANLLCRRPDIRAAERRLAAQSAQIGISTAQLYPQIAITGTIGLESQRLKDLFDSNSSFGSIGPSLRWDILNYGRNLNRIRIANVQFQALILAYRNTVLRANQEVEDGLAAFLGSQQLVRTLTRSVKADQEAVELVVFQYREGKVDFNRVFTVQRELVQQQNQLAQAQGGVVQGLIQIYRALGGGWEFRCPQTADSYPNGIETPAVKENTPPTSNPIDLFNDPDQSDNLDKPNKPENHLPAPEAQPLPDTPLPDTPLDPIPPIPPISPTSPIPPQAPDVDPTPAPSDASNAPAAPSGLTSLDPGDIDPNAIMPEPVPLKRLGSGDLASPMTRPPR